MSYEILERSEEQAQPIELYRIKVGNLMYYLTSDAEDYLANDYKKYKATQITRNELIKDMTRFDDKVKISIPIRTTLAKDWIAANTEVESSVEIIRTHRNDADEYVLWRGVIVAKSMNDTKLTIECLPVRYSFEKLGNRAQYARLCRHILYGSNCRVRKSDFKQGASVIATSRSVIQLNRALGQEYVGGIFEVEGLNISRLIIAVNGNMITLVNPLLEDLSGVPCNIYRGCDKSTEACRQFNNLHNHGGFPFIPVKNIFSSNVSR